MTVSKILYTLVGGPLSFWGPRLQPPKPIGKSGTDCTKNFSASLLNRTSFEDLSSFLCVEKKIIPVGVEFDTKVGVMRLVGSDEGLFKAVGVMRLDAVISLAPEGIFTAG